MVVLVDRVEIHRAADHGADYDVAEVALIAVTDVGEFHFVLQVALIAVTDVGEFHFVLQVALNTGIDAAVDQARERLRTACRQIAEGG